MSDSFANVVLTWVYPAGQTAYNPGDTMKLVLTGQAVQTTTGPPTIENLTISVNLVAADGATTITPATGAQIVHPGATVTTPQAVMITRVADIAGRTFTIAADGLSATAIA